MPRDLVGDVTDPYPSLGSRKWYTVPLVEPAAAPPGAERAAPIDAPETIAPEPSPVTRFDIQPPRKIVDVAPVHPPLAQSIGIEGLVVIEATIAEDGRVQDAHVLRSVPLLDAAALAAVRQWTYTPTRLNGEPVSMIMTVTVNFQLH